MARARRGRPALQLLGCDNAKGGEVGRGCPWREAWTETPDLRAEPVLSLFQRELLLDEPI